MYGLVIKLVVRVVFTRNLLNIQDVYLFCIIYNRTYFGCNDY